MPGLVHDEAHRTLTGEEIDDRMTYHAPSAEGIERHNQLSAVIGNAIKQVDRIVPKGREKSTAITKLEEAKFWASAGVARNKETV